MNLRIRKEGHSRLQQIIGALADCETKSAADYDLLHKSHNAPDLYPTVPHIVTEVYMCVCISVTAELPSVVHCGLFV